ncbi:MAG: molybdate ABC transporter substrate-binding protein [Lachnospiraceae bacterium]|nr:molybdate ABC transporter substrate-binding protein [Lachnospiraceae bacterium]
MCIIMKKYLGILLATALVTGLTACGSSGTAAAPSEAAPAVEEAAPSEAAPAEEPAPVEEKAGEAAPSETAEASTEAGEDTEIQVFIAASLSTVMEEVAAKYNEQHPNVKITYNADSSGTLLTQIEEGYACDVFFSAAQKQMNTLEEDDKLVVEGTRSNVVNNQVCVITLKDSGTKVTGLKDIGNASSIALADGSVPVGKYTRQAMVNAGMLKEVDDVSKITTQEVSEQLGGVEISEQSNVSKVLAAVTEGSCEVGTTYFSDTYGFEDKVEILEKVPYDLTGNVIYPIAQIVNDEADDAEKVAALDFVNFVTSDEAKAIFEKYYFDTDVE